MKTLIKNIAPNYLRNLFLLLVLLLNLISPASASDIQLSIKPQSGSVEDIFELTVTISSNADNVSKPLFQKSAEFDVVHLGQSRSVQIVNGAVSSSLQFSYNILPSANLAPGVYQLPPGTIDISGQKLPLKKARIRIIPKNSGSASSANSKIEFYQTISNKQPYVGEQITYQTVIKISPEVQELKIDPLSITGFWSEENKKVSGRTKRTQERKKIYTEEFALYPLSSKEQILIPRKLQASFFEKSNQQNLRSRRGSRDSFHDIKPWLFNYRNLKRQVFTSNQIVVNAKDLPAKPLEAASQSYIPVGQLYLKSNFRKSSSRRSRNSSNSANDNLIKEGESIHLDIVLSGNANLNALKLPELRKDFKNKFKLYINKEELKTRPSSSNGLIDQIKTLKIELVPQVSGKVELPVFDFYYFDPKKEIYSKLSTKAQTVNIAASSGRSDIKSLDKISPAENTKNEIRNSDEPEQSFDSEILPLENNLGKWGFSGTLNYLYLNYFYFFLSLALLSSFFSLYRIFRFKHINKPKIINLSNVISKLNGDISIDELDKEVKYFISQEKIKLNNSGKNSSNLTSSIDSLLLKIENNKFSNNKENHASLDNLKNDAKKILKELNKS